MDDQRGAEEKSAASFWSNTLDTVMVMRLVLVEEDVRVDDDEFEPDPLAEELDPEPPPELTDPPDPPDPPADPPDPPADPPAEHVVVAAQCVIILALLRVQLGAWFPLFPLFPGCPGC